MRVCKKRSKSIKPEHYDYGNHDYDRQLIGLQRAVCNTLGFLLTVPETASMLVSRKVTNSLAAAVVRPRMTPLTIAQLFRRSPPRRHWGVRNRARSEDCERANLEEPRGRTEDLITNNSLSRRCWYSSKVAGYLESEIIGEDRMKIRKVAAGIEPRIIVVRRQRSLLGWTNCEDLAIF